MNSEGGGLRDRDIDSVENLSTDISGSTVINHQKFPNNLNLGTTQEVQVEDHS
jgi:hypothetical protein